MYRFIYAWILYDPIRLAEYNFLSLLEQHRYPLLTDFFLVFTLLGTQYFYMTLIPVMFVLFDREKASVFASVILISLLTNALIKNYFAIPRPSPEVINQLFPALATGFSFPSGHAQGSMTLWGLIALDNKHSKKLVFISAVMIILISFSRLYFAVHFPLDILGGWMFAIAVLGVYTLMRHYKVNIPYWAALVIFIAIAVIAPQSRSLKVSATLAGMYLGMIFSNRIPSKTGANLSIWLNIMFILSGGAGIIACSKALGVFPWLMYSLLGLWMSFIYPYTLNKIIKRINSSSC